MGTLCTIGARPSRPDLTAGPWLGEGVGVAELEGVALALLEDVWASWTSMNCVGRWVGAGEAIETKLLIMAWVGVAWIIGWLGAAMGVSSATLFMPSSEGSS